MLWKYQSTSKAFIKFVTSKWTFPEKMKTAKVTLLFKNSDPVFVLVILRCSSVSCKAGYINIFEEKNSYT